MRAARNLIRVGLLLSAAASAAAYVGELWKVFDFASQLRLQYLFLGLVGLALTAVRREWRWSAVCLLIIALNIWPIARWYLPKPPVTSTARRLKVVQFNVFFPSGHDQELIEFLRAEKPDIVTLQEITPIWQEGIQPLAREFADFRTEPRAYGTGIAVYSQIKFTEARTVDFGGGYPPSLLVQFPWEGRELSFLATHPANPFGVGRFDLRNEQLVGIAGLLNSLPNPKILIGDMNLTMWSPYYHKLIADTQLVNTREGFGVLPTWHAKFWLPFLMIPIDHCLVSPDVQVTAIRTGKNLGSDHLPLIMELVIPARH
jgi:endonuclease/exonuclease/phosphatase (EEP) superfamily protein YafD